MKLSVIDRAIAQYADLSDPEAAFRLKLLAPILRETAKIADDLPENAMEAELPDAEAVEALRRGADPIMTTGAVKLSAAVFADVVARLAAVHEEALRAEEFNVADIDWTLFASDDARRPPLARPGSVFDRRRGSGACGRHARRRGRRSAHSRPLHGRARHAHGLRRGRLRQVGFRRRPGGRL